MVDEEHLARRKQGVAAWLREQYSGLRQRGAVASQRVWRTAAPASIRGLQVVKDTGKKTFDRLRATPWRTIARRYKVPLLVLGGVLLALVLLMIIIKVPQRQAVSWRGQPGVELKDLPKLENDARTTLVQALGGAVLLIGLYFTLRNLQLTQDKQITEHYTRAIEQLGSKQLELRLGAIYALERIARDSERDYWPIMEILTAYVREHAPIKEEPVPQEDVSPSNKFMTRSPVNPWKPAADVQAVLTVLGRRIRTYGKGEDRSLDLAYTDLRGARLTGAHLERAFLEGTLLQKAALMGAHLEEANLGHTHLERAHLREAHLEKAYLSGAHFNQTVLMSAHLEEAGLSQAHLEEAYLWGTHLEGAFLLSASLKGADLKEARLDGAFLRDAHLEEANNLKVEQLATAQTLYQAHLDPPLLEQIQQHYRHLLEESSSSLPNC